MFKQKIYTVLIVGIAAMVLWAGLDINPAWAEGAGEITGVVNINTASIEELTLLPGIGKSKATAIVAERTTSPFKTIDDLTRVQGIGKVTLEKLRPHLSIAGETTAAATKKSGPEDRGTKTSGKS